MKTRLCSLLGIQYPVIQASMAWIATADLVAAVSNAGGLGTLGPNAGATTITADVPTVQKRLREEIAKTRRLTSKPFAVNFAIGHGKDRVYSDACVEVGIQERVAVAVVSQGSPQLYTDRLKAAGMKVLHVIATVEHARSAEASGVDAVITGGFEGGGHSGFERLTTFVLVPQVANAVKIPVVAGGGIGDARGFVAALSLGAEGVYMGTRFIATRECPVHPNVKQSVLAASDTSTVSYGHGPGRFLVAGSKSADGSSSTDNKSPFPEERRGMWRGLKNRFVMQCLELEMKGASADELQAFMNSPFPGRPDLHRNLAAYVLGETEEARIGCGQVAGLVKNILSAGEVVRELVDGATPIMSRLHGILDR